MSDVTVEYYYTNWCGYCKQFSPEWEKLKPILTKKGFKYNQFESPNKVVMNQEKIDGFPTIKFAINGQKMEYNGQRNANAIIEELAKLAPAPSVARTRFVDESTYLEEMKENGTNEEDVEDAVAYSVENAVQTYMKELNETIQQNSVSTAVVWN